MSNNTSPAGPPGGREVSKMLVDFMTAHMLHGFITRYALPVMLARSSKVRGLTLIRVACQPLPLPLLLFKTPASRGREGGARLFTAKTLDFESSVKVKF